MVLLAYAVAGIFTLAGALTFAELSAMMPRAGGQYNFIGAGFGRLWAYLYGWMETLIDGAASNAALAIVFVIFFNDLLGGALPPVTIQLMTVGILVAVTLLTLASVRANGFFATVITTLKVLLVLGIGCAAFLFSDGTWSHFAGSGAAGTCAGVPANARLGLTGFGAAIVGALWSYNGWSLITLIAEEVREPGRTLPRALIGARGAESDLLRSGLALPERLPHVAKNDSAIANDRGVAHVDGVHSHAPGVGERSDLAIGGPQPLEEAVGLLERSREVRRVSEVQRLPFGGDSLRAPESIPRVLNDQPCDGSKLRLAGH
jgi:hypothetical protein